MKEEVCNLDEFCNGQVKRKRPMKPTDVTITIIQDENKMKISWTMLSKDNRLKIVWIA